MRSQEFPQIKLPYLIRTYYIIFFLSIEAGADAHRAIFLIMKTKCKVGVVKLS